MLNSVFKDLDLPVVTEPVYRALLEGGTMTAGTLAARCQLPRPTLYGYLEQLAAAGCVLQGHKGKVKVFTAETPEKIMLLYQQKIERMDARRREFQSYVPQLASLAASSGHKPVLHFYEGTDNIQKMHADILTQKDATVYSFWPVQSMIDILTYDYLMYMNIERVRRNISLKAIWPPAQVVDVRQNPFMAVGEDFLREARIAPTEIESRICYLVYGHKVMMVSSRDESFGFIVESQDMALMLKDQFNLIWQFSKPVAPHGKDGQGFLLALEEAMDD